jgi:hypothetical protein
MLDSCDLLLDKFQSLDLPSYLLSKSWREGPALSGHQLVDLERFVACLYVDAADALGKQQSLYTVDVRRPLSDQTTAFAVGAAQVFFIDSWNADDRLNMSLTPTPGGQRAQQLPEIDPIGLRPTATPIDLHARRVNHEALDATRLEEAREPKGVVARLITEYDRRLLATHLPLAITGRDELCHQAFAVAAFDRIDARLLMIGKLDTQQPRVLAQLHTQKSLSVGAVGLVARSIAGVSFTSNDLDEGDC